MLEWGLFISTGWVIIGGAAWMFWRSLIPVDYFAQYLAELESASSHRFSPADRILPGPPTGDLIENDEAAFSIPLRGSNRARLRLIRE